MRRLLLIPVAALVALVAAPTAQAAYYLPRPHTPCRTHYVRRTVHVPKRSHGHVVRSRGKVVWVRQVRCVYVAPKPPTPSPTPTAPAPIQYSTHVDPTFTQDSTNPLAVTYVYDATAIANGVNLGAVGQLPAGVLNFYSPSSPGQPAGLVCSLNVGGASTGGNCLVDYAATGTYQVTTQYVPNTATAVTETDTETIAPYTTFTATQTKYAPGTFPQDGTLTAGYGVTGQNVGIVQPAAGSLTTTITDLATGQAATWTVGSSEACVWFVATSLGKVQFQSNGACVGSPSVWLPLADFADGQIVVTATYAGSPGWASSISAPSPANTP